MAANTTHYLPKPEVLDKHRHYENDYRPGELFWGIGIEREFYLESSMVREVSRDWIIKNQKPERYSVRYFNSYKPGKFNKCLENLIKPDQLLHLPVLFNAHALTHCDSSGQHETTYEKIPKPNPRYKGKVLFEYLLEADNPFFRQNFNKAFTFDGDSIEIITQNFYCTSVQKSVAELMILSRKFINGLNARFTEANILTEHLPLKWSTANHGLANMWTNPGNVSIFNNGTYHINLTAPTILNAQGKIADRTDFIRRHQKIIRFFQWLEPFFVTIYGTGDILSAGHHNYSCARGSLRAAMSRYIGCGTFDSERMENGKKNTVSSAGLPICDSNGWYKEYHENSAYVTLEEIGLDINFNKHFNHGIELRVFDWFAEERLEELITILICAMDQALSMDSIPDPRTDRIWNKLMARAITDGPRFCIWESELRSLRSALGLNTIKGFKSADVWSSICKHLKNWLASGQCCRLMIEPSVGKCSCLPF
jgi:hypothetical protein